MQIFEREVDPNFGNITTAMWNVIITLASVGYGEIYPKSFYGRIIGVIITFWGLFTVSTFVVTITNLLEFDETELKAYKMLLKL